MSDTDHSVVADVVRQEATDRQALSILLEKLRSKAEHHLAIRVHMGNVDSYVTSVPLQWITKVRFAADLPIFRESIEGSKRITVESGDHRHHSTATARLGTAAGDDRLPCHPPTS